MSTNILLTENGRPKPTVFFSCYQQCLRNSTKFGIFGFSDECLTLRHIKNIHFMCMQTTLKSYYETELWQELRNVSATQSFETEQVNYLSDLQSGGCGFESQPGLLRTKVYSAFHSSGVGKWVPAAAGKAKAGRPMAHSDCGWTCGCAGKTVKSLENTCHSLPERFCGGDSLRRCAISSVRTFYLYAYTIRLNLQCHYEYSECTPLNTRCQTVTPLLKCSCTDGIVYRRPLTKQLLLHTRANMLLAMSV